jgi:hypothetical protein
MQSQYTADGKQMQKAAGAGVPQPSQVESPWVLMWESGDSGHFDANREHHACAGLDLLLTYANTTDR